MCNLISFRIQKRYKSKNNNYFVNQEGIELKSVLLRADAAVCWHSVKYSVGWLNCGKKGDKISSFSNTDVPTGSTKKRGSLNPPLDSNVRNVPRIPYLKKKLFFRPCSCLFKFIYLFNKITS